MSQTIKMTTPLISAKAIQKTYKTGQHEVRVLRGAGISASEGEFISVIGQSGSGKSTMLHVLGLLDAPDVGEVMYEGRRIDNLNETARDLLRNRVFGFIFQFYHLLPELSLLENVMAPLMIRYSMWNYWKQRRSIKQQALEILEQVGLGHRTKHRPSQLSGGELQRGAIARALITKPRILLADEPTGNLDADTGQEIMTLLKQLNEESRLTIVMVTHDEAVASQGHRTVRLKEGRIETATIAKTGVATAM
ncbi:MAG: ABC transporter ATP-binding protein [Fuerstiella sp.]|nr:ABC transporter ATP-binding protein [Fuerstiella sp.]